MMVGWLEVMVHVYVFLDPNQPNLPDSTANLFNYKGEWTMKKNNEPKLIEIVCALREAANACDLAAIVTGITALEELISDPRKGRQKQAASKTKMPEVVTRPRRSPQERLKLIKEARRTHAKTLAADGELTEEEIRGLLGYIEITFLAEEHALWVAQLNRAVKNGLPFPQSVKLPVTAEQKKALWRQLDNDIECSR